MSCLQDVESDDKIHEIYADRGGSVVGAYQFGIDPNKTNIQDCVASWNKTYPSCEVDPTSKSELTSLLNSPLQTFNAYCGFYKIEQSHFIQANTFAPRRTSLKNHSGDKIAKAPKDRCVSPFFASQTYNHFGPLQNTMGYRGLKSSNLRKLMACVSEK